MPYTPYFKHADDVVGHLNTVVPATANPLIKAKYVGFVAVAAVTVYELAIKGIFIEFARKKHKVLGNFTEVHFDQINGRIKRENIVNDYLKRFGDKYVDRFKKKVDAAAHTYMASNRRDIKNSYANLILWRNDFAHEGRLSATATYGDVVQAYEDGKEIIRCLYETMVR
ncbi:hypothetical protein CU669_13700 [Paramagnetospirillum kuznetsovii]|uniref:RiboL-PSP-HEPN domain-containing protein n=1 Tax=Paramagnetospirillum kuznetsovii TaxID=2053833 RepID=A0A364NWK6_9PROT|nr:HEPN domain-containing protein [Paramagnetospirillum kuznetsovii]RAU21474.1 hypothetical protein CU669_13700 [Paramagnetospirillum kuznetsovii]